MDNMIDHVTLGAASLEQGVAALKTALGVEVPQGGKHVAMSTHNCVTRAGGERFLELISIDPSAAPPDRSRWFSLDDPATQMRLSARPRALCWVVRTDDLDRTVAQSAVDLGEVLPLARGDRTWRITVHRDGSLPEGGLIPAFIEWSPGAHPSLGMQDLAVTLKAVRLSHPDPERLLATLKSLRIEGLAELAEGPRGLSFVLDTPNGEVTLD